MDELGEMIRSGFTHARSLELTVQWDCILSAGPVHPVTIEDFLWVQEGGLGWFHEVVEMLHGRLSEFIHRVVVLRRDEAVRSWSDWLRDDPLVRPYLRPDLVPPAPFLQCEPGLTPGGSGVLANPARIDEELPKGLASLFLLFLSN